MSVNIASAATDLVLAFAQSFGTGSAPGLDGTLFIDDGGPVNQHRYDVSEVTAGASSTTVNMTGEEYFAMAVISLKAAGGGGGTVTIDQWLGREEKVGSIRPQVVPSGVMSN